jgi:uncharacterized protein (TIGR03084 family)
MQPHPSLGDDLLAESDALRSLLDDAGPAVWAEPTAFKGWTPYDVVAHIDLFNRVAIDALQGRDTFAEILAGYARSARQGIDMFEHNRRWLGSPTGPVLLAEWHRHASELAAHFDARDPDARVPWISGTMSARSLVSARQMETWAHAQAVFDLLGAERQESDRIRNVAVLAVNTFAFAFRNRGLAIPADKPYVRLVAPSGAVWTWNDPDSETRIEGSAVEFCQVAAQTRNAADTRLTLKGESARAWAEIAQCFAGPPHDPPAPGTRAQRRAG